MIDKHLLLLGMGIIVAAFALEFLIIAICVKLICWGFGLVFSWKLVIGIWAVLALVSSFFKSNGGNK